MSFCFFGMVTIMTNMNAIIFVYIFLCDAFGRSAVTECAAVESYFVVCMLLNIIILFGYVCCVWCVFC